MVIWIQRNIAICQCNASTKYRSVDTDKQVVCFAAILFSLSRESLKVIL